MTLCKHNKEWYTIRTCIFHITLYFTNNHEYCNQYMCYHNYKPTEWMLNRSVQRFLQRWECTRYWPRPVLCCSICLCNIFCTWRWRGNGVRRECQWLFPTQIAVYGSYRLLLRLMVKNLPPVTIKLTEMLLKTV